MKPIHLLLPALLPVVAFVACNSGTAPVSTPVGTGSGSPPVTPVGTNPPITVIGNGSNWSDPATWGGAVPSATSSVTIPAGKTVTVDRDVDVRDISVYGALRVADKDLEIRANYIMVHGPGIFQVSNNAAPFTKKLTITLKGSDQSADLMGMGTKFLGAMAGGKIEIIGENRVSWTQLGSSASKGSSTITLKESMDWRKGERIVIASSSLDPDEVDERTITAVNGSSVTLDKPLTYDHYGQLQTFGGKSLDERSEVALLTRNIVIQGDEASSASKFGGHVMVMGSSSTQVETNPALRSSAKIQGVEFQRMGQFDRLGRYPIHWHRNGDSTGDFLKGSSIHNSLQRGVVVHETDKLLVQNNVVYNTVGHNYVVEDGTERANTFDKNLGLLPRAVQFSATTLKDQNDKAAAAFWLRTAAGTYTGNTAAGGQFAGFWFDQGTIATKVASKALLSFSDNTVHSHVGGRLAGTERDAWGIWQTDEYTDLLKGVVKFERVNVYKNTRGIETIGRGIVTDSMLADNSFGFTGVLLKDSTVVSRSANLETDYYWGRVGMFAYGGHSNADNVTWVGFKGGLSIAGTQRCDLERPRFSNKGAKMIDSDPAAGCGDGILSDTDGSISGTGQPQKIVRIEGRSDNANFGRDRFGLVTSDCRRVNSSSDNSVAICPNYDYRSFEIGIPPGPSEQFLNDNWQLDLVREEDGLRLSREQASWLSYAIAGKLYRLEIRNRKDTTDTKTYGLETVQSVSLELRTDDLPDPAYSGPELKITTYDPAWATRSVIFYAAAPTGAYRIKRCSQGSVCDRDPTKWEQLGATSSLAALQSGSSNGYAVDGGRVYFKLFGGDQLRFER